MPKKREKHLPKIYQSSEYKQWLKVWVQMIEDGWVIYEKPLYRFFSMSGHRKIVKMINKQTQGQSLIFDFGCGHGQLFHLIDPRKCVGVDCNHSFLVNLKKKFPQANTVQADFMNSPFATNSIDFVTSLHVLEHLYFLAESLEEILRILKPQGQFLFSIPTEGTLVWELGRQLITGPRLKKRYGLDVNRIMSIEHIHDAKSVLKFVRLYFTITQKQLAPFPFLPFLSTNSSITCSSKKLNFSVTSED